MNEMIHRNGRLAANIRAGRSPLTPEMIETIRLDANAGLDIPGPRALQLHAEIERLCAIEQRAADAARGNASETDEYERGWLDACAEILHGRRDG